MKKNPIFFIDHMIDSINIIEGYVEGLNEEAFKKSIQAQDCCIRRLEIIGEAVKNLSPAVRNLEEDVPWKKIAGMRDVLIHEYFGVDLDLTWRVLSKELSPIKRKLLKLRKKLDLSQE